MPNNIDISVKTVSLIQSKVKMSDGLLKRNTKIVKTPFVFLKFDAKQIPSFFFQGI